MKLHTPGPWDRIIADGYTVRHPQVYSDAGPVANATWLGDGRIDELNANARLIAAAPELLAVLQELAESAEYWSEYDVPVGIVDRINDAIAKAVGDTPPKCRCNFRQKTVGDGCAICNPELAADYATAAVAKAGGES